MTAPAHVGTKRESSSPCYSREREVVMGHAIGINRFLKTGSEMENVVGINLILIARWLGELLLKPLHAIGFTALAMFGAWPATLYLFYMAIDS